MTEDKEILRRVVAQYGVTKQLLKTVKELAKLSAAILIQCEKDNTEAITEEMAAVYIMLEQLKIIFENEEKLKEKIKLELSKLKIVMEINDIEKQYQQSRANFWINIFDLKDKGNGKD